MAHPPSITLPADFNKSCGRRFQMDENALPSGSLQ
jgi:hypothetical protein